MVVTQLDDIPLKNGPLLKIPFKEFTMKFHPSLVQTCAVLLMSMAMAQPCLAGPSGGRPEAPSQGRAKSEVKHQPRSQADAPRDEIACKAQDGLWTSGGGIPRPDAPHHCVLPERDAGQLCSSSSDCDSALCEPSHGPDKPDGTTIGHCAAVNLGGCIWKLEKGRRIDPRCVE